MAVVARFWSHDLFSPALFPQRNKSRPKRDAQSPQKSAIRFWEPRRKREEHFLRGGFAAIRGKSLRYGRNAFALLPPAILFYEPRNALSVFSSCTIDPTLPSAHNSSQAATRPNIFERGSALKKMGENSFFASFISPPLQENGSHAPSFFFHRQNSGPKSSKQPFRHRNQRSRQQAGKKKKRKEEGVSVSPRPLDPKS